MSPLIIMAAAFLGMTALVVGIAAFAGLFNTSKAEDRLAVMTRRKGRDSEAEGVILDELFPDAKAGLAGAINKLFRALGPHEHALRPGRQPGPSGGLFRDLRRLRVARFRGDDASAMLPSRCIRWVD